MNTLSQKRPPHTQLPEITDLATFNYVHSQVDAAITHYIDYPRVNAIIPSVGVRLDLNRDEAVALPANNAYARIRFANIAHRHITAHSGIQRGPLHYVTITPAAFAARMGDECGGTPNQRAQLRRSGPAARFSIRRIQSLARQALGAIPFVGMVEAVMYKGWGPNTQFYGDWISWHCHLITWGYTHKQLSAALVELRKKHDSMIVWNSVAHIQQFSYDQLEQKIAYSLKSPQKSIRIVAFKQMWISPTTGEIRQPGLRQTKYWMRTGERVRMLDVLANHTLGKLFFGNNAGSLLANAIREEALQPLRREEKIREMERRHRLRSFELPASRY